MCTNSIVSIVMVLWIFVLFVANMFACLFVAQHFLMYVHRGRKATNLCQLQLPIKASVWACKNLLICLGSDDYFVRAEWLTISLHTESEIVSSGLIVRQ